jgi:hypothetical protein
MTPTKDEVFVGIANSQTQKNAANWESGKTWDF